MVLRPTGTSHNEHDDICKDFLRVDHFKETAQRTSTKSSLQKFLSSAEMFTACFRVMNLIFAAGMTSVQNKSLRLVFFESRKSIVVKLKVMGPVSFICQLVVFSFEKVMHESRKQVLTKLKPLGISDSTRVSWFGVSGHFVTL